LSVVGKPRQPRPTKLPRARYVLVYRRLRGGAAKLMLNRAADRVESGFEIMRPALTETRKVLESGRSTVDIAILARHLRWVGRPNFIVSA
jgi:hypothetical protein